MKFSHWLGITLIGSIGILLWSLRDLIIQIFAAIVIAMAICTLVGRLRKTVPISRSIAFCIILFLIPTILIILGIVILPPFTEEFNLLILELPKAAKAIVELTISTVNNISEIIYGEGIKLYIGPEILQNGLNSLPDGPTIAKGVGEGINKLINIASDLGLGLLQAFFVTTMSIMIAAQPNAYREVLIKLVPSFYRKRTRSILFSYGESLSSWMTGLLISSICVALLAGLGLSLLGIKLVIANALLAGILNIIPNLGPIISTLFPFSVAILDTPWKAFAVILMYIIIQNLESYLITPSVMQRQTKLLPALTLSAQFIFTIIFGALGLLLAIPLALFIQVIFKEIIIHDLLDPWKKKLLANE